MPTLSLGYENRELRALPIGETFLHGRLMTGHHDGNVGCGIVIPDDDSPVGNEIDGQTSQASELSMRSSPALSSSRNII